MGHYCNPDTLDAVLDSIAGADFLYICSQAVTTFTEALTYKLGYRSVSDPGIFTKSDSSPDGRRLDISSGDILMELDGKGTHIVLVDSINQILLYAVEMEPQVIIGGAYYTLNTWHIILNGPTAAI